MTVTTSYPGVYIQELPSLVHTIQPAPTSIAVFVGYTHPFLTKSFKTNPGLATPAIRLFSFADYQANFGGFFSSAWQPDYVGQAVYQFFLNGGPTCYVVGLPAKEYYEGTALTSQTGVAAATAVFGTQTDGITFTALQPVANTPVPVPALAPAASTAPAAGKGAAGAAAPPPDPAAATPPAAGKSAAPAPAPALAPVAGEVVGIPMQVHFSNCRAAQAATDTSPATDATADIVISYGTTVETHRKVSISDLQSTLQNSVLVQVTVSGAAVLPATPVLISLTYGASMPMAGWTVINPSDFGPVFADNAPLDKVPIFNLLATPGITDNSVTSEAVAYCERKRAFYIMDTPSPDATGWGPNSNIDWDVNSVVQGIGGGTLSLSGDFPVSVNAASYYPWVVTTDPVTGAPSTAPPSGFVAGIYGQEDNARGVWKSPAGIETALLGTTGVHPKGVMTDSQQGILNQNALNCLRQFPGIGTVVYGARTTAGADINTAQQQWKYVAVRRMALFIEQTLYANLTWAVFEGNSTPLWNALTQEVTAFMLSLFRQNAFAGNTPSQAFVVQCDSTTTTATDVANGRVNILVGFAPLVPAEFVVVQIAQLAGQAQS